MEGCLNRSMRNPHGKNMRKHNWTCLQAGRTTPLCPTWESGVGRVVGIWRAKLNSVLRWKAWLDRFFPMRQDEPYTDGSKLRLVMSNEMGKKSVPSRTSLSKAQVQENWKRRGQKHPRGGQCERSRGGDAKWYPHSAADNVPAKNKVGRCLRSSEIPPQR